MRKRLIGLLLVAVSVAAFYFIWSYGFIEITVSEGAGSGDFTYEITRGQQTTTTKTNTSTYKKFVKKGMYEVAITQGESGHYLIVESPGFLGTQLEKVQLEKERDRSFVGDNPSPCMEIKNNLLVSFACNGPFNALQSHEPATATHPTYTRLSKSPYTGYIEGVLSTKEGTVVVLNNVGEMEDQGEPHVAYILGNDLTLSDGIGLKGLDEETVYAFYAHKDGFVAYDERQNDFLYFNSRQAQPTTIKTKTPQNNKMNLSSVSVQPNSIITIYSTEGDATDELESGHSINADSEIIVSNAQEDRSFAFEKHYISAHLCGTQKLCLLQNDGLDVFDVSANKPKLLYTVSGVEKVEPANEDLIVVRNSSIVRLDIDNKQGRQEYTFGGYQYCGLRLAPEGYVLCLVNNRNRKVALRIYSQREVADPIDKKIARLLESEAIDLVSIYGNIIYISPKYGTYTVDSASDTIQYDPETKKNADNAIAKAIQDSSINRTKYQIINTLQ